MASKQFVDEKWPPAALSMIEIRRVAAILVEKTHRLEAT
jgi:hypothetical protein